MKLFHLYRVEDLSGVSGTGPVVEGVEFTNGWCALRWMSKRSTVCFYQSIEDVRQIHGHGGRTELIIHDFEPSRRAGPTDNARFELFLELVEQLSSVVNMAEDRDSTREEFESAIDEIRKLMTRLEIKLRAKIRQNKDNEQSA